MNDNQVQKLSDDALDRSINVKPGSPLGNGAPKSDFGGMSPDEVAKGMAEQTGGGLDKLGLLG